jgi:hypothetical protein
MKWSEILLTPLVAIAFVALIPSTTEASLIRRDCPLVTGCGPCGGLKSTVLL